MIDVLPMFERLFFHNFDSENWDTYEVGKYEVGKFLFQLETIKRSWKVSSEVGKFLLKL